mmetsp:Transcript_3156/g.4892  ORF Transcript_3156/g.4892 Transcript_3156/m.4892 type:complete len:550 (-) Transcript_3156:135-1784(-)|eukprot:CAMPEP_0185038576 /NCGR_PEP_ID=MMETSP1103-20130426/34395_1 /TAXON_ID=36769 /ORGANISM="Paraphysomonas bandaiensis, Strain Caron Lab Isolate" /LENGTH=549 /DNA_ID=CAMNT_0027577065 /DNA_START=19 /DNA_END=1668 /DNA_ORIENTATION=-
MIWVSIIEVLVLNALCCSYVSGIEYDPSTCRDVSLINSTWPSDHGDSSRSKYTIGGGFPSDFDVQSIKRIDNNELDPAQWIYTGGTHSEFIYTLGGPPIKLRLGKYSSKSLELLQTFEFPSAIYLGGLLLHANGNVYAIHANRVWKFSNGDLTNYTSVRLDTDLNGRVVQTNGMLVSSDGLLVIKQWSMNFEDLGQLILIDPDIPKYILGVYVVAVTIALISQFRVEISFGKMLHRYLIVTFFSMLTFISFVYCFIALLSGGIYNPWVFFASNLLYDSHGGGGELKLIDPETLQLVAGVHLTERCSFARMALTVLPNGENAMVLLGDEHTHQYRWNPASGALYEVVEWSKRYRNRGEGTFPGTGPAIFNNTAYFTDNTFPVMLRGHSYTMFSQQLHDNADLQSVHLTKDGQPGVMFWSTVVSPREGDVIVWDTYGQSVQSRKAHDLSLHWEIPALQMDCISVAADTGYVYFSDYSDKSYTGDINYMVKKMILGTKNTTKYLIIADTSTGRVVANVSLFQGNGMRSSVIVPGAHNDVIIGTPSGLSRLYV